MASRYYFPFGTNAPNAPVTDIATDVAWDITGSGFQRGYLTRTKKNTALSAESSGQFAETTANVVNVLHKQYVSDPLSADQTISGTFTLVLRCGEASTGGSNPNADISLQCIAKVVDSDGNTRGVLYGGHNVALNQSVGAVGQEMATTTQVRLMNGVAVSPVDALAGDRIVVELGARHHNTTTIQYQSYLHLGDSNVADHPLSTNSSVAPGWFELSADIAHGSAGTGIIPSEIVNADSVGMKVAQDDAIPITATTSLESSGARADTTLLDLHLDNADGTSVAIGDGITLVSAGSGTLTYRYNNSFLGNHMEVATTGTASTPQIICNLPARSTMFVRFYLRIAAIPATEIQVFRMRGTGMAQRLTMKIAADGKVILSNGTSNVATSSNPIAVGKWVMVQAAYSATTISLKTFEGSSWTIPSKTLSGDSISDTIQSAQFGLMASIADYTVRFDEIKADSIAEPLPVTRIGGTGSLTGTTDVTTTGLKRAVSAGFGVYGFLGTITSTGAKKISNRKSGSGIISGISNLTRTGKKVAKGSGGISGTANLTRVGKKVAKGAVSVSGSLAAGGPVNAGIKVAKGSAAINGAVGVVNAGIRVAKGSGIITSSSAIAATVGRKKVYGSGIITGSVGASNSGQKIAKGQPAQTLTAITTTFGSIGKKARVFGDVAIAGSGSVISQYGRKRAIGSFGIAGFTNVTNTGRKIVSGSGIIYDTFTLDSVGARNSNYASGNGDISGTLGLISSGKKVALGTGLVKTSWSLSKLTRKVAIGNVSISGVTSGPSTTIGQKIAIGNLVISGTVGAGSIGSKNAVVGMAIVNGFITATASGRKTTSGTGLVQNAGNVTISGGKKITWGIGLIQGSLNLISQGNQRQISYGSGSISGVGSITTTGGSKYVGGTGSIGHTMAQSGHGIKIAKGSSSIVAQTAIETDSGKASGGQGYLSGVGDFVPLGRKIAGGSGLVYGEATLTSPKGRAIHVGDGAITGIVNVISRGHARDPRSPIRVNVRTKAKIRNRNLASAVPVGRRDDELE